MSLPASGTVAERPCAIVTLVGRGKPFRFLPRHFQDLLFAPRVLSCHTMCLFMVLLSLSTLMPKSQISSAPSASSFILVTLPSPAPAALSPAQGFPQSVVIFDGSYLR